MATYKEFQQYIKKQHGFLVKTCWIADAKEKCGLNPRTASNRISLTRRENPCPEDKIVVIKNTFKHFGLI